MRSARVKCPSAGLSQIPTSIADAIAQNEILQIVVFAVFFAVAKSSTANSVRAAREDHPPGDPQAMFG
jgi:Na+/H+-dicarboxylate symporter